MQNDGKKKKQSNPAAKHRIHDCWSIGICEGSSPLSLRPATAAPVLTARDVNDVESYLVADPFLVPTSQGWQMFFEVFDETAEKGLIARAESDDGLHWAYKGVVLEEPFHLSYPYVIQVDGDYFMVPETLGRGAVSLYRADPFPGKWTFAGTLLDHQTVDPSLFYFNDLWWMYGCFYAERRHTLRLFYATELVGPWREHPCSPVVNGDSRFARPAGRVLVEDGSVIRFAQDCSVTYGQQVWAFEVVELSSTAYRERLCADTPILFPGIAAWAKNKAHHVDAQRVGANRWIAVIDGS